ncbi:MAG: acetolactate decarboxylase [Myxococcota bacterium]
MSAILIASLSSACTKDGGTSASNPEAMESGTDEVPTKGPITLHVFGPELPFMLPGSRTMKQFAWSELMASGDAGVGTITGGGGEIIGFDGKFFAAVPDDPVPHTVSDELTPTGVVTTFTPEHSMTVPGTLDLAEFQAALDRAFERTETFVYVFKARAHLELVEYQLAGPNPSKDVVEEIRAGRSQEAVTIGTPKRVLRDVDATLLGIRSPGYLNTVFEVPYHIHFLADDKSALGHITRLQATDIEVDWAHARSVNVRYWSTE